MLRRKQEFQLQLHQIADALLLGVLFWLAHLFRHHGTVWFGWTPRILPFEDFTWLLAIIIPFGPILLELQGHYLATPGGKSIVRSFMEIFRAFCGLGLVLAGCVIFLRYEIASRSVPLLFGAMATVALLVKEHVILAAIRQRSGFAATRERIILAGPSKDIADLEKSMPADLLSGMEIVGRVDIERQPLAELVACLHLHSVERVVFAADHSSLNLVEEAIGACETEGVEVWLMANFIRTTIARPGFESWGGRPVLVFRTTPDVQWALLVKSLLDKIVAFAALVALSPVLLAILAAVRLTSPGPALFCQERSGRYGKPFKMYKFRSMYRDAEQRRAELAVFNEMSGPVFKVTNDPRITPIGHWLRKTSLDEFPQLFNVLTGDMSLVGPRPLPVYEVEKFDDPAHRRRLSVKPGLTCLWQISGRNKITDFKDWVRLDLQYIDNWSLALDIEILIKTVPVVLLGFGAK